MNHTSMTARGRQGGLGAALVSRRRRLVGVDAARGLALIGLMAIHLLPSFDDETHEPTWSYILFSGDSAALFALLAGVGLALSSGGQHLHQGKELVADRLGLVVRAVLIAVVGLWIGTLMPEDAPADNILIYYGVFFLLAIPFLGLGPKTLFFLAVVFGIGAPMLMQALLDSLPEYTSDNPTFTDVVTAPGATAAQLLLTGTYPALPYMTYLLVGMAVGRLNLREVTVQVRLLAAGVGLTIFARVASYFLLYAFGGYQRLLDSSSMSEHDLEELLVWGPDSLPTSSGWWLVITTPHTNTPLAIAASLGMGLAVLGAFLLIGRKAETWLLPLSAMGAMTLTLYTGHLVALSFEVHYDLPHIWFIIQLGAAALFAIAWQQALGQGPLERAVATSAKGTRRLVLNDSPRKERV